MATAVVGLTGAGVSFAGVSTAADLGAPTNTAPITAGPSGTGLPLLVNVRYGRHDAYDRTVFDFTGGLPGYRVEYGTLYTEGKGDPVPIAGVATLAIHFHPAYAHNPSTGASTYNLGQTLNPNLPTLRQIRFGGEFEGYVAAGLGLNKRAGFRVFTLTGPDRVVVDVAH
jgi:hypothetical protein